MHIRGREVYALYYSIKRGDIYNNSSLKNRQA